VSGEKVNQEIIRRNKPPLYEVERGLGGEYMRRRRKLRKRNPDRSVRGESKPGNNKVK